MPTVPRYDERQVSATPLPGARRQSAETLASSGGPMGQALEQTGQQVMALGVAIADKEREDADALAETTFQRQLGDIDHQVDTNARQMRGMEAVRYAGEGLSLFDEQAGKVFTSLANDRQRQAFQRARDARRDSLRGRLNTYALREYGAHEKSEAVAGIATAASQAIAAIDDPLHGPSRVQEELKRIDRIYDTHASALELTGPSALAAAKAATRSEVLAGGANRLLALGRDRDARVWYEEHGDKIDGKDRAALEKALQSGSLRGESQRQADLILARTTSEKDAIALAKAIEEPALRDEVQGRIEHEWRRLEQEQRGEHETTMRNAVNILDRTPDIRRIPVTDWESFTIDERASLKRYAEVKTSGGSVKTNPAVLYKLITLASTPATRDEWLQLNLLQYQGDLSTGDMEQMMRAQAADRKGDDKLAAGLLSSERVQGEIVDEGLRSVGLDPTPDKNAPALQVERVLAFRRSVRGAVQALEGRENRKATDEEVQRITDRLLAQTGTRPAGRNWYGGAADVPAYAFELAQAQATAIAQVPQTERRRIEDALRRNRHPVTDANVLRLFNQALQRDRRDR